MYYLDVKLNLVKLVWWKLYLHILKDKNFTRFETVQKSLYAENKPLNYSREESVDEC